MFLFIYYEEILGGMLLPQPGIGPSDTVSWTQVFPPSDDFVPLGKKDQILRELGCCDKCRLSWSPNPGVLCKTGHILNRLYVWLLPVGPSFASGLAM